MKQKRCFEKYYHGHILQFSCQICRLEPDLLEVVRCWFLVLPPLAIINLARTPVPVLALTMAGRIPTDQNKKAKLEP